MVLTDIKMWMKVVPHNKTPDGRVNGLENSVVWKDALLNNQEFLYVAHKPYPSEYLECRLVLDYLGDGGDYFMCSDFKKYNK